MADSSHVDSNIITMQTDSAGATQVSVVQSNVIESSRVDSTVSTGGKGEKGDPGAPGTTDYNDLTNKPTLGTAAATNSADYATAAQGTKADTAVQPATLSTYATASALTSGLATKADTTHTHAQGDITGLSATLSGKADTTHSHAISDTTGLQAALDGKATAIHTHVQSDVTGLTASLGSKQDTLVSGTNIKTVNGTSVLGSGNISISPGAVDSVNAQTGAVVLDADDISDTSTTNKFVTAAEKTKLSNLSGTNTGDQDLSSYATNTSVTSGLAAKADTSHTHTATDVTSGTLAIAQIPTGTTGSTVALGNHTHSGYEATVASGTTSQYYRGDKSWQTLNQDAVPSGATNKAFTSTEQTKLAGVATGATANSSDATLLNRANHTGSQAQSTVTNLVTDLAAKAPLASPSFTGTVTLPAGQVVNGVTLTTAGGTSNFLRADGTYAAPAGGGGGSPGGNANELQYNDGAGGFAGAANVEVDNGSGTLKLVSTTDPSAPSGGLLMYSKQIAGRHLPKIIGPSGIDTVLQVGLHGNAVFMVAPASGTTAPTAWGGSLTTATTMSVQQTIASANPWLATWRKRFASAATAAAVTGMRTAYTQWFRGNAAGYGGFFFRTQFGHNLNLNGSHLFVGLCASTGALGTTAGAVAALVNMIGMGYDSTDANTGNWQLYRNDGTGTATKVDLGANALRSNVSHGYDLIIYCPPGAASDIYVRVVNLHTNVVVLDTSYNTDIPAVNTGMAFKAEVSNVAVASAANIEVAKVYIETDY